MSAQDISDSKAFCETQMRDSIENGSNLDFPQIPLRFQKYIS